MTRKSILGARGLAVLAGVLRQAAAAEELAIDLSAPGAAGQWVFLEKTASIRGGELVLDGRHEMSRAFFTPVQWKDVTLQAESLVEPHQRGVVPCEFVVRARVVQVEPDIQLHTGSGACSVRVHQLRWRTFMAERLISDEPAAYSDLTLLKDKSVGVLWERGNYRFITFTRLGREFLEPER